MKATITDIKNFHHILNGLCLTYPSKRIAHIDADGIYLNEHLSQLGVYCCVHCGYMQPIELHYCKKCLNERDILIPST